MLALVLVAAIVSFVPESDLSVDHHNATFAVSEADVRKRSVRERPVADIDGWYAAQSMSAELARICCRGCVMAAKGCRRKLVTAEGPVPVETGSAEVKQSLRRRG